MPTCYAAGVTVRLSTTSPSSSLTAVPARSPGEHFSQNLRRVESEILSGGCLSEQPIPIASPFSYENAQDDFITFLGQDRLIPFYCVGIRPPLDGFGDPPPHGTTVSELFHKQTPAPNTSISAMQSIQGALHQSLDDTSSELSPPPSTIPSPTFDQQDAKKGGNSKQFESHSLTQISNSWFSNIDPRLSQEQLPRCLILTVKLDKHPTVSRYENVTKVNNIRIDVFLNGHRTHSFMKSHDSKDAAPLVLHFSGMRIGRLLEAAWLFHYSSLPTQSATRFSDNQGLDNKNGAQERWDKISRALAAEADMLGFNEKGQRSLTGDCLNSIASLHMPPAVESFQGAATKTFGVVDVMVTVGSGKKYHVRDGYLREPVRLRDPRFGPCSVTKPNVEPSHLSLTPKSSAAKGQDKVELQAPRLSQSDDLETLNAGHQETNGAYLQQQQHRTSSTTNSADDEIPTLSASPLVSHENKTQKRRRSQSTADAITGRVLERPPKRQKTNIGAVTPDQRSSTNGHPRSLIVKLKAPFKRAYPTRSQAKTEGEKFPELLIDSSTVFANFKSSVTAQASSSSPIKSDAKSAKHSGFSQNSKATRRKPGAKQRRTYRRSTGGLLSNGAAKPSPPANEPFSWKPDLPYREKEGSSDQTDVEPQTSRGVHRAYQTPQFEIPELSVDSVVSYQPPSRLVAVRNKAEVNGARQSGGGDDHASLLGNGAVRQVRSERNGEFIESAVLLSCRFIVGA